jgi:hypothetical protein
MPSRTITVKIYRNGGMCCISVTFDPADAPHEVALIAVSKPPGQ